VSSFVIVFIGFIVVVVVRIVVIVLQPPSVPPSLLPPLIISFTRFFIPSFPPPPPLLPPPTFPFHSSLNPFLPQSTIQRKHAWQKARPPFHLSHSLLPLSPVPSFSTSSVFHCRLPLSQCSVVLSLPSFPPSFIPLAFTPSFPHSLLRFFLRSLIPHSCPPSFPHSLHPAVLLSFILSMLLYGGWGWPQPTRRTTNVSFPPLSIRCLLPSFLPVFPTSPRSLLSFSLLSCISILPSFQHCFFPSSFIASPRPSPSFFSPSLLEGPTDGGQGVARCPCPSVGRDPPAT